MSPSPIVGGMRGPQGPAGAGGGPGPQGDAGVNAYSTTFGSNTQPAVNSAINVRMSSDGTWAAVGQIVYVAGGGFYEVLSPASPPFVTLRNLGYVGNAAPGAPIASGSAVSPAGPIGAANLTGTSGALVKFTGTATGGDSIITEAASVVTVGGASIVTGRARQRTAQGGGWRDLLGPLTPPNVGGSIPVVTQIASSPISQPLWQIGDKMWATYHVGHDYAIGTDVYIHVHWLTSGTQTRTTKWQVTYYYARGYNVEAFALGGAGTVITIEQAAAGVAYQHMISESAAITIANLEPDGYVFAEIKRITNGGTDNTDGVFAWNADMHYQSVESTTGNRNGPWGT